MITIPYCHIWQFESHLVRSMYRKPMESVASLILLVLTISMCSLSYKIDIILCEMFWMPMLCNEFGACLINKFTFLFEFYDNNIKVSNLLLYWLFDNGVVTGQSGFDNFSFTGWHTCSNPNLFKSKWKTLTWFTDSLYIISYWQRRHK